MSLINPVILYGLLLAAIPVLLHFLMRAKPKKLLFPALRLIQARRKTNARRLRLRHIWLMLLRVGVIVLLVLALARPSLPAANYGLTTFEALTLAGIAAAAAAAYFATTAHWRRQGVPNHVYTYRRALLRGGTGIAAVLLLLLLVVWPYQRRISAEWSAPRADVSRNLPVAAVFLFDTSLSMEYQLENRTRLQQSQEIALEYLERLPAGSRVAVADSAADQPILFQADLAGASSRIDALQIRPAGVPLNDRVRAALAAQEEDLKRTLDLQSSVPEDQRNDQFIREIYVFTDMAASAWRTSGGTRLRDEMERLAWANAYLIDVGVDEPRNVALSRINLSRQTVPVGGELIVEALIDAVGMQGEKRTVELHVENEDGKLVKQGQSTVTLDQSGGAPVSFAVPGLAGPVTQGELRLLASDPLAGDDVRYFTVAVRPPPEILLVGESRPEAADLQDALAPAGLVRLGKAPFRVDYLPVARLSDATLESLRRYDAVCLVNLRSPSERAWATLRQYVANGGGLAVFLGHSAIDPVAYISETPLSFLPGEVLARRRFDPPEYLDLESLAHPILNPFEEYGGAAELSSVPVYSSWNVKPLEGASVIANYTFYLPTPALLERVHGEGRVVMLTTAADLRGWSDLPRAGWQFPAFIHQMMNYLGRRSEASYNFIAGEQPIVELTSPEPLRQYRLRKPGFEQRTRDVPEGWPLVTIDDADQIGHYLVLGTGDSRFKTGFSVNVPQDESDLTPIGEKELDALFGEKRYRVAESIDALEKIVGEQRLGQEVFPYVLLFVVCAFAAEHLVANRFYEGDQAAEHH